MTPAEFIAARSAQRAKLQQANAALQSRPRLSTAVRCPFCGWCIDEEGLGHASDSCAGIVRVPAPPAVAPLTLPILEP